MRLIGAESGLTIAIMRLAATMLPNPMLINRVSIAVSPWSRSRPNRAPTRGPVFAYSTF
jgi:hypothetical protein